MTLLMSKSIEKISSRTSGKTNKFQPSNVDEAPIRFIDFEKF